MLHRDDIDVREIMAAGEDATRTIIGGVLDSISTTATERAAKWQDSDEAIENLQRIRQAVNSGEELTWAVVDFWLSTIPDPTKRTVRVQVTDEEYAALAEQGADFGMTGDGYLTALAQKSAKDHWRRPDDTAALQKALVVAASAQQAEQWIIANATVLEGWQIFTHVVGADRAVQLRGRTWELAVYLTDANDAIREAVAIGTRRGPVVTANPTERFDLKGVLAEQALRDESA